jgi:anti-anti-sigma factor
MNPLTITASHAPGGLVLEAVGDLDHTNAQRLRHAAQEAEIPPGGLLVVDLSRLEFCDSSGITALIAVRNRAEAAGGALVLVVVSAALRRLLNLTGLDQVLDVRDAVPLLTDH